MWSVRTPLLLINKKERANGSRPERLVFGECVGAITQDEGYLSFHYLPKWLESKNAKPLSQSLPLRAEPFDDKISKPFFAGLLPEGDKRVAVANTKHFVLL